MSALGQIQPKRARLPVGRLRPVTRPKPGMSGTAVEVGTHLLVHVSRSFVARMSAMLTQFA